MMAIISSCYQYGPFLFFVAEVMSNYLTTDGLKKNSLLPEAPLWPEARGICHICHMLNLALVSVCFHMLISLRGMHCMQLLVPWHWQTQQNFCRHAILL